MMRKTRTWLRAAAIVVFFGVALYATGQATSEDHDRDHHHDKDWAKDYCQHTGGLVEFRHAVYGTNNPPSAWLWLAGEEYFCQYTASDTSRIHVSLETLTTKKPTLAALAYYAQVPWNGKGNGNPASFYCSQLGGAEIGATDFAGGAWVSKGGIDQLLETCVFPDNSTIDSWGLLYHSVGIIRGEDLTKVLKYPNPYPPKAGANTGE
jgi:putative hemolysin